MVTTSSLVFIIDTNVEPARTVIGWPQIKYCENGYFCIINKTFIINLIYNY